MTTSRPVRHLIAVAAAMTLAAGAAWLCFHHGRRGFLPLDQSIVFDGGWRLFRGQVPFVDFVTPAALVPSAMQAAFFQLAGVTMFAYALHAAVVNAAFALVSVALMRRLGAGIIASMLVGAGSAVVFYPPMGLPYADQHSFFFSLCCLSLAVVSVTGRTVAPWAAALTPAVAMLAFFSKPIPAVLICVPAVAVAIATLIRGKRWRMATTAAIAPFAAVAIAIVAAGIPVERAWYFAVTLPASAGVGRVDVWVRLGRVAEHLWGTVRLATPFLGLALPLGVLAAWMARGEMRRDGAGSAALRLALLALALGAVTTVFAMLTNKNPANALALLFIVLGVAWRAAASAMSAVARPRIAGPATLALAIVVLAAGAHDAWRFNRDVIATRAVNIPVAEGARDITHPGRTAYLRFQEPYGSRYGDILWYLSTQPLNFLLIGDSSFLYGVHQRPSISPALWFHRGLTMPEPGTPEFERFESALLDRMHRYRVSFVVLEPGDRQSASIDMFPRVQARVDGCPITEVAEWVIRHVCR